MSDIIATIIRRPRLEEKEFIQEFFTLVLRETFQSNGLQAYQDLLEEEIVDKKRCLEQDFMTDGKERFFLLAEDQGQIIGSIEYGLANELLEQCTNHELKGMLEIGTVFVHPEYRQRGVASSLFSALFRELANKGEEEICFDSGYKKAQKIWCNKFGEPEYFLENYWGDGDHHMVWRVGVKQGLMLFPMSQKREEKAD